MFKRFTAGMALLLALAQLTSAGASAWQGTPAIKPPDATATLNATDDVLKTVSRMRELEIKEPVKSAFKTRDEIEQSIIRDLDESTPPAEFDASQKTLVKLGLVPGDFRLRDYVVKLLREQVAGFYEPKTKEFYLAAWLPLAEQKKVMAHELMHALQDQHFNLRRFEKWPKGDADAELAAHALIEGDATVAMMLYMAKNPLIALAFIRSLGGQDVATEQFKQAPRALRESLLFPYQEGSEWATELYHRGGWDMVSKAFTKLPQSTEQILHADKYFSYEAPQKVTLPDFRG